MTVTRRAVGLTPVWTDTLQWYARAVARMRQRPASDPTSWTYQAAIHGTDTTPLRTAWNSCQHGGWYFLAWHRAYLFFFERIVRAAVVAAGGPQEWALPYWNYENPQTRALPRAFRELTLPGAGANPLRASARDPDVNRGARLTVSSAEARLLTSFSTGPMRGFGGSVTPVAFQANGPGKLELNPHGDVHVIVGGGGWMSRFQTAALDPIFWLHHCNLDRIWAEWDRTNANPTAGAWLNQRFTFFDETGARRTMTPAGVVDIVGSLDYTYDTLPVPVPATGGGATVRAGGGAAGAEDRQPVAPGLAMAAAGGAGGGGSAGGGSAAGGSGGDPGGSSAAPTGGSAGGGADPELVGSSATPVSLRGAEARVTLTVDAATAAAVVPSPAGRAGGDAASFSGNRMYLQLDDIAAESAPNVVYGVYVSAEGAGGRRGEEHRVGSASFFGAEVDASGSTEDAHPLSYVFDVTDTLPLLADERGALPGRIEVVFRPLALDPPEDDDVTEADADADGDADAAYLEPATATMRVGRVALFAAPPE